MPDLTNPEPSPLIAPPAIAEAVRPDGQPIVPAPPATDPAGESEATAPPPPPKLEAATGETTLGAQVSQAIGFIAGLPALCYAFGFLCINAYLRSQGVITFSAVSSEYLAAGLCFGCFYVVAGIIAQATPLQESPSETWQLVQEKMKMALERAAAMKLEELRNSGKSPDFIGGYARTFGPVYKVSYVVGYIIGGLVAILRTQFRDCVLIFLVVTSVCRFSTHDFRALHSFQFYLWILLVPLGVSLLVDFALQTAAWKWRLLPFVLATLLLSAEFYGQGLYPNISSSIGGGTPVAVRFVVDPANRATAELALGTKIESDMTPPLNLLLETSDSLLVTLNGRLDQIVQFKKDQVKAVVYGAAK
jgi:hypothetical protein